MYSITLALIIGSAVFVAVNDLYEFLSTNEFKKTLATETPEDNVQCECSLFRTATPQSEDKTIVSQKLIAIGYCNEKGAKFCAKLCNTIALKIHRQAPHFLCNFLSNCDKLEVFLHSRTCDWESWRFTGLRSTDLCCGRKKITE
ncbi:uncharacterized protein LOC116179365 [Photinus pyralis]|uniref:uncharacterized protein LOC116179365 n=1 Tax=Photinus pyralis TaxID=7054 RepID=UPI0012677680|nr:uncharacterized protein LOC116179365 [Photinus pyralis]